MLELISLNTNNNIRTALQSLSQLNYFFFLAFTGVLNPIVRSVVCKKIATVETSSGYEKTLCYVAISRTHAFAEQYCSAKKMRLYVPKSSSTSYSVVSTFVKNLFEGRMGQNVFVEGRDGKKCSIINGKGYTDSKWCTLSSHFICEYLQIREFLKAIFHMHSIEKKYMKRKTLV